MVTVYYSSGYFKDYNPSGHDNITIELVLVVWGQSANLHASWRIAS